MPINHHETNRLLLIGWLASSVISGLFIAKHFVDWSSGWGWKLVALIVAAPIAGALQLLIACVAGAMVLLPCIWLYERASGRRQ